MRTILPLGALLALSLAGCASSTGPEDLDPSLNPGRPSIDQPDAEPKTSCADPTGRNQGHPAIASDSGSESPSVWYSVNSTFSTVACPKHGVPV